MSVLRKAVALAAVASLALLSHLPRVSAAPATRNIEPSVVVGINSRWITPSGPSTGGFVTGGFYAENPYRREFYELYRQYLARALLRFELPADLPPAAVTAAHLVLTGTGTPGATLAVYPLTADWTPAEVTWVARKAGVAWANGGGDFDSSGVAYTQLPAANQRNIYGHTWFGGQVRVDVTNMVRNWLGGAPNHGVAISGGGDAVATYQTGCCWHFGGTQGSWRGTGDPDPSLRPRLEIAYDPSAMLTPPGISAGAGAPVGPNRELTFTADPAVVSITVTATVDGRTVTLGSSSSAPHFPLRLDTSLLPDGRHTLLVTAATAQGATSQASVDVVIDNTPPPASAAVAGPEGKNGWRTGPSRVTLTAGPDASGIDRLEYQLDGSAWTRGPDPAATVVELNEDGRHAIHYRAVDGAGNAGTEQVVQVNVDSRAPRVEARSEPPNAAGWHKADVAVSFAATDPEPGSGVASVSPQDVVISTEGAGQTVTATAEDEAGNTGTGAITVNLDKTPPVSRWSVSGRQGNNGWYTGPVTLTAASEDTLSGVARQEHRLDGGQWAAYASPLTVSEDGTHTAEVHAVDRADNVGEPASIGFRIDQTPPVTTATLAGLQGKNGWFRGDVTVTLAASDNLSGVARAEYSLDGGATWQPYIAPFTLAAEGEHRLLARSADVAGNVEDAKTVTVRIDRTAPEFRLEIGALVPLDSLSGPGATLSVPADAGRRDERVTTLTIEDVAGNATSALLEVKGEGAHTRYEVREVRYNGRPLKAADNKLEQEAAGRDDEPPRHIRQKAEVKRVGELAVDYDPRRDVSTIHDRGRPERRSGRVSVGLQSEGGRLRPVLVPEHGGP